MTCNESQLIAYLAGDFTTADVARVDVHLLECERCWLAVQEHRAGRDAARRLREPAPAGLADRIRFALELSDNRAGRRRIGWLPITSAVVAIAAVIATAVALLTPTTPNQPDAAVITRIVQLASVRSPSSSHPSRTSTAPTPVGAPLTVRVDGQRVRVQYYDIGGRTALAASAPAGFPAPRAAHPANAMPWQASRGAITLYCPRPDVLLAGAVPAADLANLAAQLHLT